MPTILDNDIQVGTGDSSTVSKSFSWADGDILTVLWVGRDNADLINTITATGLTFSKVGGTSYVSSRTRGAIWQAKASGSGSGTITVTFDNAVDSYGVVFVQTDGDTANDDNGDAGADDAPTMGLTTTVDGCLVIGIIGTAQSLADISGNTGAGYSILYDDDVLTAGSASMTCRGVVQYITQSSAGAITFDGSIAASAQWIIAAVAIAPVAGAARRRVRVGVI